jgi:hypothetical protein
LSRFICGDILKERLPIKPHGFIGFGYVYCQVMSYLNWSGIPVQIALHFNVFTIYCDYVAQSENMKVKATLIDVADDLVCVLVVMYQIHDISVLLSKERIHYAVHLDSDGFGVNELLQFGEPN